MFACAIRCRSKTFGNDCVYICNRNRLKITRLARVCWAAKAKQKSVVIEADMANAKYERALARARLALIAPAVDDVTAAYFDGQVEKVLREARQRGEKSDQDLMSTLLDAVARRCFSLGLRDGESERSDDDHSSGSNPPKS